jgi:hypothetical protein
MNLSYDPACRWRLFEAELYFACLSCIVWSLACALLSVLWNGWIVKGLAWWLVWLDGWYGLIICMDWWLVWSYVMVFGTNGMFGWLVWSCIIQLSIVNTVWSVFCSLGNGDLLTFYYENNYGPSCGNETLIAALEWNVIDIFLSSLLFLITNLVLAACCIFARIVCNEDCFGLSRIRKLEALSFRFPTPTSLRLSLYCVNHDFRFWFCREVWAMNIWRD